MRKRFTLFLFLWSAFLSSQPTSALVPIPMSSPSAVLANWTAEKASGGNSVPAFAVKKIGMGPPMILIPGLLSSGEVWTRTVERYQGRYECHVLTIAGFAGQAPIPSPVLDTVRQSLLRYIEEHQLRRPILVGHSLGGFLAFWVAATAPSAVGGVIAVDGVPYLPALHNSLATPETVRAQAEQLRQLYATFTPRQLLMQSKMSLSTMMKSPADVERVLSWVESSTPETTGEIMYELMLTDLREPVRSITAPVLLLGAAEFAKDESTRARVQEAYEAQVAKVAVHTVTLVVESRHFIMFDAPEALWAAMDAFLAKLQARVSTAEEGF